MNVINVIYPYKYEEWKDGYVQRCSSILIRLLKIYMCSLMREHRLVSYATANTPYVLRSSTLVCVKFLP